MLERLVARLPTLLLLGLLAVLLWSSLGASRPDALLAGLPAGLVLVAYLRAGKGRS